MNRICDLIEPWVRTAPDSPALTGAAGTWTYGDLRAAVDAAAAWLTGMGVRAGDRVLLVSDNCPAYVALLLAAARLDAWPVLVNARLATAEIAAIAQHARPRRVVLTPSRRAKMHAQKLGAEFAACGLLGEIAAAPLDAAALPEPLEADVARRVGAVLYTSGTTGTPRGVMLSHRGLIFAAQSAAAIRRMSPRDRLLAALPMTHSSGLSLVLLAGLSAGAGMDIPPRLDPVTTFQWLEGAAITVWIGAPAMFAQCAEYARFRGWAQVKAPHLRLLSSCSAPLSLESKRQTEALFGHVLHNGYGITECSPGISATRLDAPRDDTAVGEPYPGVEVRIIAADGQTAPDGQSGEIWVRGPNLMLGYYRAAAETAAVLGQDGWFHTGDLGRRQDGVLFLLGRTKELIIRFGFNVYPSEIETLLEEHPAIRRAAVLAVPASSAAGGEEILAFLQPANGGRLPLAEITAWLRPRLAHYKQPSQWIEVEAMPLTPTGKVRKEALRVIFPALAAR